MFSRILVLVLVLGFSSAFAGQKNSLKLEIGVNTCEAFPEDCTNSFEDFYKLTATLKGNVLTVKSFHTSSPKQKWTRKATLQGVEAWVVSTQTKQLTDVKVERVLFPAVCEIAVSPAQFVDLLSTLDSKGKLRPVLGPTGCWVSDKIYPTSNYELAQNLKATLRKLAVATAFAPQN